MCLGCHVACLPYHLQLRFISLTNLCSKSDIILILHKVPPFCLTYIFYMTTSYFTCNLIKDNGFKCYECRQIYLTRINCSVIRNYVLGKRGDFSIQKGDENTNKDFYKIVLSSSCARNEKVKTSSFNLIPFLIFLN